MIRIGRISRALMLSSLAATPLLLASVAPAFAQSWPQKSVKFILPLGPGSGSDIVARSLAERLQTTWGQPIVVENRPGGDAVAAITAFINANDDHILLFSGAAAFAAHPYLLPKLPYDPTALVPIVRVHTPVVAIVVPTTLGSASMADFAARARAEPGRLNYAAITGIGDLLFQSYLKRNSLNVVRVPYRDGVQALTDVGENRIQVYSTSYAVARPQVQGGKVKVLALHNSSRVDMLPDIPTAREAGFPQLEWDASVGLFGPRSLTAAMRERIAADVISAVHDQKILARLQHAGLIVNPGRPAEFAATIELERGIVESAANILGLKRAE